MLSALNYGLQNSIGNEISQGFNVLGRSLRCDVPVSVGPRSVCVSHLHVPNVQDQGFVRAEDGSRLFYEVHGSSKPGKPTLMLCDGIGCDGFVWRYIQPYFAENFRVIHWHYRGHGRSGAPAGMERLEMPDFAKDAVTVLDHVGDTENVIMMGHSMGTQVCLETYRAIPERVNGLVLLCGSSGRVTHTFHGTDVLSQVLPSIIETAHKHRGLARAIWGRVPPAVAFKMARLSGEVDENINEEDFRHYWEHICVMDPDVFLAVLRNAGEHSADDLLPKIKAKTLIVAAERDTFTPPELAKRIADTIPTAEMMMIRGGSHAAPVEQPVAIQLRIEKFLIDLESEQQAQAIHKSSA